MRDPKRIKIILKEIEKLWKGVPDWRFGQMLINSGLVEDSNFTWNVEDDGLLNQLRRINSGRKV